MPVGSMTGEGRGSNQVPSISLACLPEPWPHSAHARVAENPYLAVAENPYLVLIFMPYKQQDPFMSVVGKQE